MLKNKSKWGKRENPVGTKPPLKINIEEVTNHPDELTPNNEWRWVYLFFENLLVTIFAIYSSIG